MSEKVYVLQRLNFENEVEKSWAIEGFDKAVEVARKLAFEYDTQIIRTCTFSKDFKEKQLRKAREYFDNLDIAKELDKNGEWTGYLGTPPTTWVLRELDLIK